MRMSAWWLSLVWAVAAAPSAAAQTPPAPPFTGGKENADFAARLDLSAIRLAAVQHDGRVKTVDSLAREMLKLVDPSGRLSGGDALLAYLDLLFDAQRY